MRIFAGRLGVALVSLSVWLGALALPANADPPGTAATPENLQKLYGLLSEGYAPGNCEPVDVVGHQTASLDCGPNAQADELIGATYTLYTDAPSLHNAFSALIGQLQLVTCPGLGPSPTTWHFSDTPDAAAGSLACSEDDTLSSVFWTDDANMMVAEADSFGYIGPLYQWWRTGG
jgi:serine/threonine kinase PknH